MLKKIGFNCKLEKFFERKKWYWSDFELNRFRIRADFDNLTKKKLENLQAFLEFYNIQEVLNFERFFEKWLKDAKKYFYLDLRNLPLEKIYSNKKISFFLYKFKKFYLSIRWIEKINIGEISKKAEKNILDRFEFLNDILNYLTDSNFYFKNWESVEITKWSLELINLLRAVWFECDRFVI